MERTPWVKEIVLSLVVVMMLTGVAWADPVGTASVFQFVEAKCFVT